MAMATISKSLLFVALVNILLSSTEAKLKYGFYNATCPGVEDLVRDEVKAILTNDATLAPSLLRLHFHDCFVQGCDASIMLNSHNGKAEKDADPNLTVRGYEMIESIKAKVEAKCPLVVSCADIIAMAARDSVSFSQGPSYQVETGRRDGNISSSDEALTYLPPADGNFTVLAAYFDVKNLTLKDLVVLSGAHTIGVAHCPSFSERLYNFTGAGDEDPSLDKAYSAQLAKACKAGDTASVVPMDAATPAKFDLGYYQGVYANQGLLGSDAALLEDSLTEAYVQKLANATALATFFSDFVVSMINMGRVDVLTGAAGEIRKTCGIFVD